jgi:hypothetical protein
MRDLRDLIAALLTSANPLNSGHDIVQQSLLRDSRREGEKASDDAMDRSQVDPNAPNFSLNAQDVNLPAPQPASPPALEMAILSAPKKKAKPSGNAQ